MSWKVHDTDDVFAELRGLCSNSYRMYDPSEHRSYYDHDCETYECAVEDAAEEYERLLVHCAHQKEELAKLIRYMQGEAPAETIDLLIGLLNEYRESGCALDESRVSWYARRLDGRTMNERSRTEQGSSSVRAGSSITDELREWVRYLDDNPHLGSLTDFGKQGLLNIADCIDARHRKALEKVAAMVDEPDETERRIKALEHLTDGMLLDESELRERVEAIERKLNHRGER